MTRLTSNTSPVTLLLKKPEGFDFRRTVLSHGWCVLPPFLLDRDNWVLYRTLELESGRTVSLSIRENGSTLLISCPGPVSASERLFVRSTVRHILQLDQNLDEFLEMCRAETGYEWIAHRGAGRLLRSPTVYEDVVKMICTTNCSWSLTEKMVGEIVRRTGSRAENEVPAPDFRSSAHPSSFRYSFPAASRLSVRQERFFRESARCGYRSPYLREFAKLVVRGAIRPESWQDGNAPTEELKERLLSITGVGPYAAEQLLRLLGRFEGLALDSWTRKKFSQQYHGGRKVSDRTILRRYAKFGTYKGLALWCDLTRDWLD